MDKQTNTIILGTTVFRAKFFQIPWVILSNSTAYRSKFSTQ